MILHSIKLISYGFNLLVIGANQQQPKLKFSFGLLICPQSALIEQTSTPEERNRESRAIPEDCPKTHRSQRPQRSPRRPLRLPGATKANPRERRQRSSRTSKDPPKNFSSFSARPLAGGFCGRFANRDRRFFVTLARPVRPVFVQSY